MLKKLHVDYGHAFLRYLSLAFLLQYISKQHVNFLLAVPVNIPHELDLGWTWAGLILPHSCPSWLRRGWASPTEAQVLAGAYLVGHAQAFDWACRSCGMSKHMIG